MAHVKTSVDNLNQQKREYEKAVKSLNNALEQIKKVNRSLGKDDMLEGVRTALTKLSASLETRAEALLLMTKTLEQSGEKYTAAQKKAVAKSNQFRAHNRDFYGNPVVVTATTVVVSASGADSSITITSPNTVNVSVQTDSEIRPVTYVESGFGTDVSQASAPAGNTAIPEAAESFASELIEEPVSTGSVGGGPAEVGAVTGDVDTGSSNPGANVFATGSAATEAAAVTEAAAAKGSAATGAAAIGAAAATGAVIGGVAVAAMDSLGKPGQKKTGSTQKEKEQELTTDIEAQLEAARERLRRINEEQDIGGI
ncbi:MAG: hypothetical protein ACI4KF_08805 [Huintestinicola sp.]